MSLVELKPITPAEVLHQVSAALPESCREDIIIIGSLAASYSFHGDNPAGSLRTKDVDALFTPYRKALISAHTVTEQLLNANWTMRPGAEWSKPGTAADADDQLPMVRLRPPTGSEWFIELLSAPDIAVQGSEAKELRRLETSHGHFAICSFLYLGLAEFEPAPTPYGIRVARPEMMALANLLHHPTVGKSLIAGTQWKRSNKDLGRVIAMYYLRYVQEGVSFSDEMWSWGPTMWRALQSRYPASAQELALRAGNGLRELQGSFLDQREALEIANAGLLSFQPLGERSFAAYLSLFMDQVIVPLEKLARA